jgi:CheY-like chemotaxis protein
MGRRRILVIDDSEDIHKDFARILCPQPSQEWADLSELESALFGLPPAEKPAAQNFEVDMAFQGKEGVAKVQEAVASGHPYDLLFLDYRMPPGWNGLETLRQVRKVAPVMPIVLCSAFSDYSWEEMVREFGAAHHLTELRKPFDKEELYQLALSLTEPQPEARPH